MSIFGGNKIRPRGVCFP